MMEDSDDKRPERHERAMPTPGPPRLTRGQRGAIQALLQRVAQVMERYEQARGAPLEERLAYVVADSTLTDAERTRLDPLMRDLTEAANTLARAAVAAPIRYDRRALLRGEFAVLWSEAEDTAISRLSAYGPVSIEARATLGATILRLIGAADALMRESVWHSDVRADSDS